MRARLTRPAGADGRATISSSSRHCFPLSFIAMVRPMMHGMNHCHLDIISTAMH
jgi:hypothetical protein